MPKHLRSLAVIVVMAGALPPVAVAGEVIRREFRQETTTRTETIEVYTRGPVHEAFAEPVVYDPGPGLTVSRQIPQMIDELPPNQRPEGDNVAWVPGYWSWDDDRDDFLWVSGTWRTMPPGRQFVPGYWAGAGTEQRWVSGFWALTTTETIEYLPEPPALLESGPPGQPPNPGDVWVPGIWLWHAPQYLWRPGYWLTPPAEWVWVPARYIWTPTGYIYVGGYWDYALPRRGLLFAPVYVQRPVYTRPGFVYSPSVVVNISVFETQLFARPRYGHYYFGDYYEERYFNGGIYPAYAFHRSGYGYSPIFAHYAAYYRARDPQWEVRLQRQYRLLRERPEYRPPRTLVAQRELLRRGPARVENVNPGIYNLVRPLAQLARAEQRAEGTPPIRLQRIENDRREEYRRRIAETRQFQGQRAQLETREARARTAGPGTGTPGPVAREAEPTRAPVVRQPTATPATPDRQTRAPAGPATPQATPAPVPPQPAPAATPTPGQTVQTPAGGTGEQSVVTREGQPTRITIRQSPLADRPLPEIRQRNQAQAPPARPKVPQLDRNARPTVRSTTRPARRVEY